MSTALVLQPRIGERYEVETGAFWLDLIYTGGEGFRAQWESLHAPADVVAWLRQSRLSATAPLPSRIAVDDDELTQIRALREAIWRTANALADGSAVRSADARALTEWASAPDIAPALRTGKPAWANGISGAMIASSLARDAIATIAGPLAHRVRRCEGDHCGILFVDTSRPGQRRWCSMTRCGNRAKAKTRRAPR